MMVPRSFSFATLAVSALGLFACSTQVLGEEQDDEDDTMEQSESSGGQGSGGAGEMPSGGGPSSSAGGTTGTGGTATEGTGGAEMTMMPPPGPKGPSDGCGDPRSEEPKEEYLYFSTSSGRQFFPRLPANYDGDRAYPVVFYGPGCGASSAEPTPVTGSLGQDAILVFLVAAAGEQCFETDDSEEERSPELAYFDEVLKTVQDTYCTEKSKVFVSGYSSGSWLSHLLACHRGDVIRGIGSAAGGLHPPVGECVGQVAAILHGSTSDTSNPINDVDEWGYDHGSMGARDRRLLENGCTPDVSRAWDPEFPECEIFDEGCSQNPVVWCVDDSGHSTGGNVSGSGFWKFWSALSETR